MVLARGHLSAKKTQGGRQGYDEGRVAWCQDLDEAARRCSLPTIPEGYCGF